MPFENFGKYRQQKQDNELHYVLPVSEEDLDLERKIDAITIYQRPYTKKILFMMGINRANIREVKEIVLIVKY